MKSARPWLLAAVWLPTAAMATSYVATPLGTLGGASIYGTGINAGGQVSGWGDTDALGAVHRHAFVFSDGALTNLGTLSGGAQSFAYAINDAGSLAGSSNASSGPLRAVVYTGGTVMTQVATFALPWRIAFLPDGRMPPANPAATSAALSYLSGSTPINAAPMATNIAVPVARASAPPHAQRR